MRDAGRASAFRGPSNTAALRVLPPCYYIHCAAACKLDGIPACDALDDDAAARPRSEQPLVTKRPIQEFRNFFIFVKSIFPCFSSNHGPVSYVSWKARNRSPRRGPAVVSIFYYEWKNEHSSYRGLRERAPLMKHRKANCLWRPGDHRGPSFGDCAHNVDLKKYFIRTHLRSIVIQLCRFRVSGQDRGPAIFQFADQHSSSAVILITSFLEKFMAKLNCLLLKVSYEGVKKLAGWSGHWEVYWWSHVLKTHVRHRFHWN